MKRIVYGNETFVVDDRSGAALMQQALAIAESRDPELVRIDVVQADGSTREASLIIGPWTPVSAVDAPDLERSDSRPMARIRSIDPDAVYDDAHTYFDLGFDS
ncbi:hypothetical protein [Labedella endophytica]|jgi:hypothetical protein|uniref:Uncharacterized protein n=1 Tax=Labedella endophytica TaxID=1523160 RepID=A0A433JX93_9MICO|nr:hypothetical protein [Labedella endophytica]RUR03497.1 hypothetical protein ELQ94_02860 [Labedella endophytica]